MERDIRFKEASARAQYINFKAKLLSDELDLCSGGISNAAPAKLMRQVYVCMKSATFFQILNRFEWLMGRSDLRWYLKID